MAVRNRSTHIPTKQVVCLDYVDPRSVVNYPSEWFLKHPGAKPTTLVPKYDGTQEDLIRAVKGGIRGASLNIKTVKVFLYRLGLKVKYKLAEDWESFGVTLGTAGSDLTPWSLINIQFEEGYVPTEPLFQPTQRGQITTPDDPQDWTEIAMALYIFCIYRLCKITNDEYAELLIKRMEDQVRAEGGRGMSFHGARSIYGSWLSDASFLKMVAAYDMFLHRFNDSSFSILRMGTLGSRFRDCAGLLSFGYAMTILNIASGDLMDWIFLRTMGDEVIRLTKSGEEVGNPFSYFPYQADLNLVRRSAYSSNANPYLFTWIHVVGSILGHKRSQNARFFFEGSLSDVGLNAVLIAWVYARGGELSPQFASDGINYGDEVGIPDVDEGDEGAGTNPEDDIWIKTQGRDPKTWYSILKNNGFRIPRVVAKVILRQREKIIDVRDDTVGDYVKQKFIY